MTTWTQDPLMAPPPVPDIPDPQDIPRGSDGQPLGGESKWTPYKGAHRPCDRCIKATHEGLMKTYPQPARRRRKGPNGDEFLCLQHGERQESRDRLVAQRLAGLRDSTKKRRA